MDAWQAGLVAAGGFGAGALNAVAGGGSFLSFPAMLAVGVPPVSANASNSVALWPASLSSAWAFRAELARHRAALLGLCIASLCGGVAGGLLLLATQDAMFARLIPWLLLFATVLFAAAPYLAPLLARRRQGGSGSKHGIAGLLGQGAVAVYGGFFGAGMGILMMASLSLAGLKDVHEINAIKNLLSAIIYSVTVVTFVLAGAVNWPFSLVMVAGATLGGYWGARMARKIPALWLRRLIIAVGLGLTVLYFFKTM